jgi:hypothetical protein
VRKTDSEWKVYRTRFLIQAKQLTEPLTFSDSLGREHSGQPGDYLVLSSDGARRIAPREIFEDIYVPMDFAAESWSPPKREVPLDNGNRRGLARRTMMV